MKTTWIWIALFLTRLALADSVAPVPATNLFVPVGYDDNDEVEVMLEGYLPNTCYQITDAQVSTDVDHKVIVLEQMAYVNGTLCLQMIVPYSNTVRLGRLPAGTYTVETRDGKLRETLIVERAPVTSVDNSLYAPIDSASVAPSGSRYVAVLDGRYTNTCLRMKEVKVKRTGHTLQVLPVMELRKADLTGGLCKDVDLPFRFAQRLPRLQPGRYLLHVRSLNGRSVNVPFTVVR